MDDPFAKKGKLSIGEERKSTHEEKINKWECVMCLKISNQFEKFTPKIKFDPKQSFRVLCKPQPE